MVTLTAFGLTSGQIRCRYCLASVASSAPLDLLLWDSGFDTHIETADRTVLHQCGNPRPSWWCRGCQQHRHKIDLNQPTWRVAQCRICGDRCVPRTWE